jgi:hypothetical protein
MVNQIDLVGAISKELDRQGIKNVNSRQLNTIIKAADMILLELEIPNTLSKPGMGLEEWLLSDDTGSSSKYMACILLGKGHAEHAYPHDSDDFGRCYRFLQAVPEAKKFLNKLSTKGEIWRIYIENWPELEYLYDQEQPSGKYPKLSAKIRELLEQARMKKRGTEKHDGDWESMKHFRDLGD